MRDLLLDTHIWLWSLIAPQRLSPEVREAITRPGRTLWLSAISAWEAHLLAERGRIQVDSSPRVFVQQALRSAPIQEAPLTADIAVASRSVALPHRDPADRFIVATALVRGLVLVTADADILRSRAVDVLPA